MYVYKITNLLNNKMYVGITKRNPKFRFIEHGKPSRKKYSLITSAIHKYGKSNFQFEVIYTGLEYITKEKEFIALFNTMSPNGYNLTSGGENYAMTAMECIKRKERRKTQKSPIPKGYKQNTSWVKARVKSRIKPVIGTCLKTQKTITFYGATEIKNAGFSPSVVFNCANGKLFQCFGYTWEFVNQMHKKTPYKVKAQHLHRY